MIIKAGFGGGCHWCTEAVFASLKGVISVEQGWIASDGENTSFSEAVLIVFDSEAISFHDLIAVHVYTHSATSEHSMRGKYRSAVYTLSDIDAAEAFTALQALQQEFVKPLITAILPFNEFKINREDSLNYYYADPEKPFCRTYINPKLELILKQFGNLAEKEKIAENLS